MQAAIFLGAALIAGAMIPFQAGANAALGRALGSPLWGALISLTVSMACMLPAMLAIKAPLPVLEGLSAHPKWIWLGGIGGAVYVTAAVILAPKLGAAGFMVAVISGQILASLVIDRFGLAGFTARPIDMSRLIGAGLIVLGMLVLQGPQLWQPVRAIFASNASP